MSIPFKISLFYLSPLLVCASSSFLWSAPSKSISDLKLIRSLIPKDQDLAHMKYSVPPSYTLPDSKTQFDPTKEEHKRFEAAKKNYVFKDLNGDRYRDLLVITDQGPCLNNSLSQYHVKSKEGQECSFNRFLHLYLGGAKKTFTHNFTNDHFIMRILDGGVAGDPLKGFHIRKNGSIALTLNGGSSWWWTYIYVFQFRRGHYYLVGEDQHEGWFGDGRVKKESTNYITGDYILSERKRGDQKVKVTRSKRKRTALKKVKDLDLYE